MGSSSLRAFSDKDRAMPTSRGLVVDDGSVGSDVGGIVENRISISLCAGTGIAEGIGCCNTSSLGDCTNNRESHKK
jgi:hypothetical protein